MRNSCPLLSFLEARHSGHVGEYAAWLLTGATVLAAVFVLLGR